MRRSISSVAVLALALVAVSTIGLGTRVSAQSGTTALTGATSAAPLRDEDTTSGSDTGDLLRDQREGRRAAPFGSELFSQTPPPPGGPILDPAYVLRPGDTVSVSQWGLVNSNTQQPVDPQGNIMVPGLGPVHVGGVAASDVNDTVGTAASQTYRDGVKTYATPLSATTIQVFVTGPVVHPGLYAGSSTDSIVGFLQRAGGPNSARGSYRRIAVRRSGRIIARADLYAFLRDGEMPDLHLQQGDVIVDGEQGPVVTVGGDARAPFTFELAEAGGTGEEVLRYARPRPEVTDVTLLTIRGTKPTNVSMPISAFAAQRLADGDRLRFDANSRADTYLVRVSGAVDGARSFVVPRGAVLASVLSQLRYDPQANRSMIHLSRLSVAKTQKQLLDDSLARLEKVVLTTPSVTSTVAQGRQYDAAGLERYIERARTVQPAGLVSVRDLDPHQVLLEPNDEIIVPYVSQNVTVGGEVALPQSIIAAGPLPVLEWVKRSGGFGNRADRSHILVIAPDGSSHVGGMAGPGDRVMVPPRASNGTLDLIRDVVTIIYQLGVAAAAVTR